MTKTIWPAAFVWTCAAVALLTLGTGARAEEGVAIKNMLGSMGLIPRDKDPIRYRERASLVVPPKMELREPAAPETFASNSPLWPRDPDLVARREREAERRKPVTESELRRMLDVNPRLTIDEMRAGRNPRGGGGPGRNVSDRDGVWISPEELARGEKPSEEQDTSATARRTLTDPPGSFRQAARGGQVGGSYSPRIDQQEQDANPINWLTRKFSTSDDD